MKRRKAILVAGLFALAASVGLQPAKAGNDGNALDKGTDNRLKYELFELSDVQLLDGPFKRAMEVNGEYLMKLDANRLLAPYLKEAGLEPKAGNYGGWESGGMHSGLSGHSLGHYVSALSMIYASTGQQKYKERLGYVIDELARCQEAIGTGYVGGVPNGQKVLKEVRNGKINAEPFSLNESWVPWYNLHKLYAGLRDAYRHAGSQQALDVLLELSEWTVKFSDELTDEEFQTMLQTEHGGMKEVMADVYEITGEQKYLELTRRFTHKAIFEPLMNAKDELEGEHANTQIPKIIGAARHYEVSGNEEMKEVARFFWNTVVNHRTYVNGGNSDGEHFGPRGHLSERLSRSSSESCNTYNMMKLTRHLTQWKADPAYADYYERALYNHILASQDPETGMFAYYMSMEQGFCKTFSKPFDSFWCCVGTGMENHTKYGRYIYMHGQQELLVNLYIPSRLEWEAQGVTLHQETSFPVSQKSTFTIEEAEEGQFALKLRRPYWAKEGFKVTVNGENVDTKQPSSYISINRNWEAGDQIQVEMPMRLRMSTMADNENRGAFMYGPLLMAGKVGQDVRVPVQYREDQTALFDLPSIYVPSLKPGTRKVENWAKKSEDKALEFKLQNVGEASGIPLAPYYKVNHSYYTIYWDIADSQ